MNVMNSVSLTRRTFLQKSAALTMIAAAAPTILPASALGAENKTSPNDRIGVGIIGCGPQGRGVLAGFLAQKDAQVLAACDVKTDQLAEAKKQVDSHYNNTDCATYQDFRELLARKDIDVVLIATPDHWHVPIAIAAAKAGKDIYLEKPMGLSMQENIALRTAVKKHKRMFQFGTQQRSSRLFRFASELARSSKIGQLKHINVWAPGSAPGGPTDVEPVPQNINYDMWLGPAQFKPYTKDLCSDASDKKMWWYKSEYALGFIAGWGIHPIDIAAWGADLFTGPIEVEGRGTFYCEGACDTATVWNINLKFASGVTMKFAGVPNGGNRGLATCDKWTQQEEWSKRYRRISSHGTAFEGTEGWVHVDREGINLQPENLIDIREESLPVQLTRSAQHQRNLLDAARTRKDTVCPIDEAVRSDSLCHISEIAIRLNRKLVWDPKKEKFINDEEANLRLRARPMREPWNLEV